MSALQQGTTVRLARAWMGIPAGAEGEITDATPDAVSIVWRALPAEHGHIVGAEDYMTAREAAAALEVM